MTTEIRGGQLAIYGPVEDADAEVVELVRAEIEQWIADGTYEVLVDASPEQVAALREVSGPGTAILMGPDGMAVKLQGHFCQRGPHHLHCEVTGFAASAIAQFEELRPKGESA